MGVYKVIRRIKDTKKQSVKKIYATEDKFTKYGADWALTSQIFGNVEVYRLDENEKWILLYELKYPKTKEEALLYIEDNNCPDYFKSWYFSELFDL